MSFEMILASLLKNGPLALICAIFLKTYIDETKIKREERKEDRQIQRETNDRLAAVNEKFAVSTEATNNRLGEIDGKLEVHSSSSQSSLAEIKQGVTKLQVDVTNLNDKVDDVIDNVKKSA